MNMQSDLSLGEKVSGRFERMRLKFGTAAILNDRDTEKQGRGFLDVCYV